MSATIYEIPPPDTGMPYSFMVNTNGSPGWLFCFLNGIVIVMADIPTTGALP